MNQHGKFQSIEPVMVWGPPMRPTKDWHEPLWLLKVDVVGFGRARDVLDNAEVEPAPRVRLQLVGGESVTIEIVCRLRGVCLNDTGY